MSKVVRTFMLLRFLVKIACNKLVAIVSGAFVRYIQCGLNQIAVTLDQGTLIGLQYKTRLSRKPYFRFLGVPYAKPPVNDLRFRPPVPHPGWSGELQAFSEGNMCMQYSLITNRIIGSEDCLYLNVFVPKEGSDGKKAVMVFIHGGIFNYGSSTLDKFSPDYLLDENVIVVTFNYRLNVLGFLNLDIDECPGNMGLKDQLLAINWTKTNISAFGGDANNITVFGESAGSASVHLHTLSPHCTDMFHKAIMQSGFSFNTWALIKNHRDIAVRLSKKLGCQSDDTLAILQYLKTVPAKDLVRHSKFEDDSNILIYKFLPSIESNKVSNPFLPVHPELLIETAPTIPIIAGINNMEGLIGIDEQRLKNLPDFRTTEAISSFFKGQYSEEDIIKIKDFYFNDRNLESETTRLENIVHLYTQKDVPTESTLRKFYLDDCYEEMMKNIRQRVFLKKIWISIDETTDAGGRQIANAIIGTLEEDRAGDIFLLNTDALEKTNHSTVCKFFDKSLSILWPDGIKHDDVLLFLSDAAPYMVKCGKSLNALYSKMVHVTCAAHGLHRTAEEVRGQFSTIDKIISNVKKIFKKSPSRVQIFKTHAPNFPLPPEPVITRWGTWLNASIYYCEYYKQICEIVEMLDSEDALSIKIAKKNLVKTCVKSNLVYIKSNFKVLSDSILKLQRKNMPLAESLDILEKVQVQLQMAQGNDGQKVYKKFETVLNKNSGLKILKQISKIIGGESDNMDDLPEDLTTNDLSFYKFAPITSVDVERSFSIYKNLLTDNRRSFKLENIRKHLLLQCNTGNQEG